MDKDKVILDATCASRMIWFNKNHPAAVYVDRREEQDTRIWKSGNGKGERRLTIKPDVLADFTNLPFPDESFYLVVFDPPHLLKIGESSWMAKKYGKLDANWPTVIRDGFNECMRVLKPYGTLIFKWNEFDIPVKKIIECVRQEPLFGNRSGKQGKTHWMTFMKFPDEQGR